MSPNIERTQNTTPADGEALLWACDQRDPRTLGPGLLNDARNLRYTDGLPATRKGVIKPTWANYLDANNHIAAPGNPCGSGVYRDPNSLEWSFAAVAGVVLATQPGNPARVVPLPTGVAVKSAGVFVQAFNLVFLFRGRFLQPLVLASLDVGFTDLIARFNAAIPYNATVVATGQPADEMAYGPFLSISSLTRSGGTVTVVTASEHGYISGADVQITGASVTAYNSRWNITVVDNFTFTFPISGAPTTPATGASVSNNAQYWKARGSRVTLTSLTQSAGVATATKASHGFSAAQWVTIAGATNAGYNGTFQIQSVTTNTFTFNVLNSLPTPDPGSVITAQTSVVFAGQTPDSNPEAWTRQYNILPNAQTALFLNDLLLVPTAFEPSSVDNYNTITGGTYKKVDYLVATNYLDYVHFSFINEFRINSGSSDEIVDLFEFGPGTAVILKGSSWAVLSNIALDLSQVTLQFRSKTYGCVARGACAVAGSVASFMSSSGIIVIRSTDFAVLLGLDVPLTAAVQATMNRVDWTNAGSIRLAHWDSKLYAAVPFTDGTRGILVFDYVASVRLGNSVWETGVMVQGWTPLDTGSALRVVEFHKRFVAGKERLFFLDTDGCVNLMEESTSGDQVLDATNAAGVSWEEIDSYALSRTYGNSLTGTVRPVEESISLATWHPKYSVALVFAGVNNRVAIATDVTRDRLTYDRPFDAAAWDQSNINDDWATPYRQDYSVSFDLTPGNVVPALTYGLDGTAEVTGLMPDIVYAWTPGAHDTTLQTLDSQGEVTGSPLTTAGTFTLATGLDGLAGSAVLLTGTPGATVTGTITVSGFNLGSGVNLLQFQEALDIRRIGWREGKSYQLEFSNSQGRIKLIGQRVSAVNTRSQKGTQI